MDTTTRIQEIATSNNARTRPQNIGGGKTATAYVVGMMREVPVESSPGRWSVLVYDYDADRDIWYSADVLPAPGETMSDDEAVEHFTKALTPATRRPGARVASWNR
ncbi:hypothetical protein [Nesterenkonia suensis]